jgi:hypothetical protein
MAVALLWAICASASASLLAMRALPAACSSSTSALSVSRIWQNGSSLQYLTLKYQDSPSAD